MSADIVDGTALAERLRKAHGMTPRLAAVLVGEDAPSKVYVRCKHKYMVAAIGMESVRHERPADIAQSALLALVARLIADDKVHGIVVQLPLPCHIAEQQIPADIGPAKDVDGLCGAGLR